jgi:hypothetical protein
MASTVRPLTIGHALCKKGTRLKVNTGNCRGRELLCLAEAGANNLEGARVRGRGRLPRSCLC